MYKISLKYMGKGQKVSRVESFTRKKIREIQGIKFGKFQLSVNFAAKTFDTEKNGSFCVKIKWQLHSTEQKCRKKSTSYLHF